MKVVFGSESSRFEVRERSCKTWRRGPLNPFTDTYICTCPLAPRSKSREGRRRLRKCSPTGGARPKVPWGGNVVLSGLTGRRASSWSELLRRVLPGPDLGKTSDFEYPGLQARTVVWYVGWVIMSWPRVALYFFKGLLSMCLINFHSGIYRCLERSWSHIAMVLPLVFANSLLWCRKRKLPCIHTFRTILVEKNAYV